MSEELLDSEKRNLLHVVGLFVCLLAAIVEYYTE
jgi:hypothetical protein